MRTRYFLIASPIFLVFGAISCAPGDDEGIASSELAATSCQPTLERYPVAGPHNGGWDKEATQFSCGGRNNSDFYRGNGGGNHTGGHLGNDIFGARGTPIVAAKSGVVVEVGNTSIGGLNVVIRDDCGWSYYYAHLDSIDRNTVANGARIDAGTQIGTLGDTGQAKGTAPHLHFSVYPGNYNAGVDPFPYLEPVTATACDPVGPPAPPFEPSERPKGGDFEALEVKAVIPPGHWITQCNESADGERVWQTTSSGPDPSARWAEAKYPQHVHATCGKPSAEGIYPIVLRTLNAGEGGGVWIAACAGGGLQHVWRVDGEVDGYASASFQHDEANKDCP
jgi:hypothetical protein